MGRVRVGEESIALRKITFFPHITEDFIYIQTKKHGKKIK